MTQVVFNAYQYTDRTNLTGTSNFSATASLMGIALYDPSTHTYVPTSQWSVSSGSGTHYAQLNAVPEPGSIFALGGLSHALLKRRRR